MEEKKEQELSCEPEFAPVPPAGVVSEQAAGVPANAPAPVQAPAAPNHVAEFWALTRRLPPAIEYTLLNAKGKAPLHFRYSTKEEIKNGVRSFLPDLARKSAFQKLFLMGYRVKMKLFKDDKC